MRFLGRSEAEPSSKTRQKEAPGPKHLAPSPSRQRKTVYASGPESPVDILTARSYRLQKKQALIRCAVCLLVFIAVLIFLFAVFGIARVNGTSMEPTLHEGDFVLVQKLWNQYKAGDVIVCRGEDGVYNIKRIIAVEGDVVDIQPDGAFTLNGAAVEEKDIFFPTYPKQGGITYPYAVEPDCVFVMGDHRTASIDSRDTGAVQKKYIIGKVLFSIEPMKQSEKSPKGGMEQ